VEAIQARENSYHLIWWELLFCAFFLPVNPIFNYQISLPDVKRGGTRMEEETTKTGMETASGETGADKEQEAGGKLFTQEELNAIIQQRLAREKEKAAAEQEAAFKAREAELKQKELSLALREKLAQNELPAYIGDILKITDEAGIDRAINTLKQYALEERAKVKPGFRKIGGEEQSKETSGDNLLRQVMRLR